MAETSIAWADFTFNPWSGCTKVAPECANCYAEVDYSVKIRGVKWGPQGNRIVKAESGWKEPLKWQRVVTGTPPHGWPTPQNRARVFCASLADVFEDWTGLMLDAHSVQLWKGWGVDKWKPSSIRPHPRSSPLTMQDVRKRLFALIEATPNLDWLLLTKRPENVLRMTYDQWTRKVPGHVQQNETDGRHWDWPANVWIGTSVGCEETAWRAQELLKIPAKIRFLSCEPLLGPLNLEPFLQYPPFHEHHKMTFGADDWRGIDWVIVGGESGRKARECNLAWMESIVDQCEEAEVPCFVKQLGKFPAAGTPQGARGLPMVDSKGGDFEEFPPELQVRQFPTVKG
jgi:protein gp37